MCLLVSLAIPCPANADPLASEVKLQMHEGRPVVDGVYVNGHGPYRFLVDTGATANQIESRLAESIGLTATFRAALTSSTGRAFVAGSEDAVVRLGSVSADRQIFLLAGMDAVHVLSPDIRGVLGQVFLSQFDYLLDVRAQRLVFGKREAVGNARRVAFRTTQGLPVVSTSLGLLILDSGAHRVVRFSVSVPEVTHRLLTVTGSTDVGIVFTRLMIDGRTVWRGEAVAVPQSEEPDVDGLLPINLFKSVYVSNSEGYVVFD
jgi:hypothetical protein